MQARIHTQHTRSNAARIACCLLLSPVATFESQPAAAPHLLTASCARIFITSMLGCLSLSLLPLRKLTPVRCAAVANARRTFARRCAPLLLRRGEAIIQHHRA